MKNKIKGLIFLLFLFHSFKTGAQSTLPNIIYILADDLGYGDISALNKNSKISTKHVDALAAGGISFTDAHSGSSVCTPTRYGILTGRYAWRTHLQNGVLWSYDEPLIGKGRTTVASLLKKSGYQTACIGKWHLGLGWQKNKKGQPNLTEPVQDGPNSLGFDYFYGISASLDIPPYVYIENDKITATKIDTIDGTEGKGFWRKGPIGNDFNHEKVLPHITDKAIDYIESSARAKAPFFLYLPLPSPHTPILPSKEFKGKTQTNEYGDFVLMTDHMVGRIVEAVKNSGAAGNTIIIFTSDNGVAPSAGIEELATLGHHSSFVFRGNKADAYEGGHRVPFIVSWPGRVKAGISETTICLTDFMATAADLTQQKLKANEGEDSYSLLPLLFNKGIFGRTHTIHHSINGNFSIRANNWKLIFAYGSGGWSNPVEKKAKQQNLPAIQLFDLKTDTAEKVNLEAKHPKKAQQLEGLLRKIINYGRSTPGTVQQNDIKVDYLKYRK